MAKKNYIIDTSVFLTDAQCVYKFANNDIFIPLKVLEEIDKHKKRQDSVGFNARRIIKILDCLREKGSLHKGIRIDRGKGVIKTLGADLIDYEAFPRDLAAKHADHMILATAMTVQKQNTRRKTIVVSRDINMRVIADSIGLLAEDYITEQVAEDADKIYSGFASVLVDDEMIERFYGGHPVTLSNDSVAEQKIVLRPNQFIMLVSSACEKCNSSTVLHTRNVHSYTVLSSFT